MLIFIASLGKRHRCFGQWTFVIMLCWPFCPERLSGVRRVLRPWKTVRERPENEALWNKSFERRSSHFRPRECGKEGKQGSHFTVFISPHTHVLLWAGMKDNLFVFIIRTKKKGSHTGLKGLGERGTQTNIRLLFQGGGGEQKWLPWFGLIACIKCQGRCRLCFNLGSFKSLRFCKGWIDSMSSVYDYSRSVLAETSCVFRHPMHACAWTCQGQSR